MGIASQRAGADAASAAATLENAGAIRFSREYS
jgi:hypothetical protein